MTTPVVSAVPWVFAFSMQAEQFELAAAKEAFAAREVRSVFVHRYLTGYQRRRQNDVSSLLICLVRALRQRHRLTVARIDRAKDLIRIDHHLSVRQVRHKLQPEPHLVEQMSQAFNF
jgi:hypothetical protein